MTAQGVPRTLALGPGPEFDTIRTMLARWGELAVGIGDDAAVLRVPRGDALVASVDSAIENRHFRADWLAFREKLQKSNYTVKEWPLGQIDAATNTPAKIPDDAFAIVVAFKNDVVIGRVDGSGNIILVKDNIAAGFIRRVNRVVAERVYVLILGQFIGIGLGHA